MEEDDDDLYGANGSTQASGTASAQTGNGQFNGEHEIKAEELEDGEEEGEEIEEDSDSDIDIITERKPGTKTEPTPQPPRLEAIKNEPSRAPSADRPTSRPQGAHIKSESHTRSTPQKPGSQYPEVHTSTVDVNGNPIYEPVGKPVTELDFDADLAEHDKPWRRPGSDQTDYFNYGFDEFTWATYCLKQKSMRDALNAQKAESAKFEMMFGGGGGGPGPGAPVVLAPSIAAPQQALQQQQQQVATQAQAAVDPMVAMGGMPGMPEMSPDMMSAMMAQMMQQGVDPGQMDFGTFMQQFQQMQGGAGGGGGGIGMMGQQGPAQGFGGQGQGGYGGGSGGGGRRGRRW